MRFSSFGCCIALLLPAVVACEEQRPQVERAPQPPSSPQPEGPKRDPNGDVILHDGDLDEDGFPREELLEAMPEKQREVWEERRKEKERTEGYLVFKPPEPTSELYRRAAAQCAPFPNAWLTSTGRPTNQCSHCTTPAPRLPKCAPRTGGIQPLAPSVLETAPTEVVTVRARLAASVVGRVGTAKQMSYSTNLLLIAPSSEKVELHLLLDTENLSETLKQLPEGPWVTQSGTLFCAGSEELCCPFDLGRSGEFTDVVVTGRVQKIDEFYPDDVSTADAQGLFRAQSICRP